MNILLVFDLNGVLATRNEEKKLTRKEGVVDFLKKCKLDNYDIAVWTSGIYKKYHQFLDDLQNDLNFKFSFCWYRNDTELDHDYGIDNKIGKYHTIKNLDRVFYYPNFRRCYNKDKTIIIDDDFRKIRMNKNYIIVDESLNYDGLYDKIKNFSFQV